MRKGNAVMSTMLLLYTGIRCAEKATVSTLFTNPEQVQSQLRELWEAGDTNGYYAQVRRIVDAMTSGDVNPHANDIGVKLLEQVISKGPDPNGHSDILEAKRLAWVLIGSERASSEYSPNSAHALCEYLRTVRREIIPNYVARPTTMNVRPPAGTPRAAAGMDPTAIEDPKKRAMYEGAIRENRDNGRINARQQLLAQTDSEMAKAIVGYLNSAYRSERVPRSLLLECGSEAMLSTNEMDEVTRLGAHE